jgi:hypothetical protein
MKVGRMPAFDAGLPPGRERFMDVDALNRQSSGSNPLLEGEGDPVNDFINPSGAST